MTGHRRRIIDKINETPLQYLEKADILELILFTTNSRKNTRPIARELLTKFHRISSIAQNEELKQIEGVGDFTQAFLKCTFKICEYILLEKVIGHKLNLSEIIDYFQFMTREKNCEVFSVAILNIHNEITSIEVIEEGGSFHVSMNIQKLVRIVLNKEAASVILCHNHPGGSINPSYADIETTKSIRSVLNKLNIKLFDSLIVTHNSFFSFADSNLLDNSYAKSLK